MGRWSARSPLPIAKAFVETEEERFVAANGSADCGAKLVLLERFGLLREIVARIEGIVAQELPQRTMNCVGARPCDDVGGGAERVTKFRGSIVRDDAELADGIDRGLEHEASVHSVHVVRAINEEIVRLRALTIDRVRLPIAKGASCFL